MLLLLDNYQLDKDILKEIIRKTFKGFDLLTDQIGLRNNFLEKIDSIKLENPNSEKYSILFINAVSEARSTQSSILNNIDKLSNAQLSKIGLNGASLKLKYKLFTESLLKVLNNVVNGFADFGLVRFLDALQIELNDLINILRSLSLVIPSLEKLIELVKALRSLLNMLR